MPLRIQTVPCRADNYAFLVHDDATGKTALVDAPEAAPIIAALTDNGWQLTDLLITHHHGDHVDGTEELRSRYGCRVIGAKADAHRLPALDLAVSAGDALTVCDQVVQIFDVSGHTVGHVAFYMPAAQAAFTADSLMAMGCGRLFEGTPPMMWDSLQRLRALPAETIICSGHEYTAANMRFALSLEPANTALILRSKQIDAARAKGEPTVPSTLADEIATNPFLRADDPDLAAAIGMAGAKPVDVFTEVRARKDRF